MSSRNIGDDLIRAVIYGQLDDVSELINSYGLSYSPEWSEGYSLLFEAVKAGNVEIAELLLSNNCQVNTKVPAPNMTALHVAVNKGEVKIVEMLLDKGADVNARDKNGKSPLHYAIQMLYSNTRSERKKEYIEIIELLIKHKADVNDCICGEEMPLHVTVKNRDAKTTGILLRGQAKPDVRSKYGITPLYLATKIGDENLVKLLLDEGATIDFKYNAKTVLQIAIERVVDAAGYPEIIEHLLRALRDENNNRDKINKSLNVFICEIDNLKLSMSSSKYQVNIDRITNDYKSILNKLLECGFTVDSKDDNVDYFLSRIAAATGYRTVVKELLTYGLDINKSFMLHIAADRGEAEMVQFLINSGADPNHRDNDRKIPIFYAIRNNKVDIVNILLFNRTEIADNAEILNAAVSMANPAIVDIALKHIDINAVDAEGVTALHCTAVDKNYIFKGFFEDCPDLDRDIEVKVEIAKSILNSGGAVNGRCRFGRTALSVAAENGRSKLVECLLNFNADCNFADENGDTAIHYAVRNNHLDVIKVLLKFDTNVDIRNVNGETALHLAAGEVNVQILKTLLDNGANINAVTCEGSLTAADYAERSRTNLYSGGRGVNGPWNEYRNKNVSYYREIIDAIEQHILKMIALNQPVRKKHLQWIGDYSASEKLNNFHRQCVNEIEIMKDTKIGDTTINFYNICVSSEYQLVKYARNDDLVKILKLRIYENKFPTYAALIHDNFKKGQRRKDLFISGFEAFHNLFGYTLPEPLIHDMFSLLSNIDVKNFIEASNAISQQQVRRSGLGVAKQSHEIGLMFVQNMLSIIAQIRPSAGRE